MHAEGSAQGRRQGCPRTAVGCRRSHSRTIHGKARAPEDAAKFGAGDGAPLRREIVSRWGNRKLAEISRGDVRRLLEDTAERAGVLSNRLLAAFRKLCNWAIEQELINDNPCDKLRPVADENSRERILSDDELRSVWRAAETLGFPFGPLAQLLALTGQRKGEVAGRRGPKSTSRQRLGKYRPHGQKTDSRMWCRYRHRLLASSNPCPASSARRATSSPLERRRHQASRGLRRGWTTLLRSWRAALLFHRLPSMTCAERLLAAWLGLASVCP